MCNHKLKFWLFNFFTLLFFFYLMILYNKRWVFFFAILFRKPEAKMGSSRHVICTLELPCCGPVILWMFWTYQHNAREVQFQGSTWTESKFKTETYILLYSIHLHLSVILSYYLLSVIALATMWIKISITGSLLIKVLKKAKFPGIN